MSIEPDTKDWTWVLERPCPECGFDAGGLDLARLPGAIRDNATLWEVVLGTDDAAVRPQAHIWSPLEYACHVRDVNALFEERVRSMLAEDEPRFANWDQDETALAEDYGSQPTADVGPAVVAAAEAVATTYEQVAPEQWQRGGLRSDGSRFTVDTLARYHLHDLVHHAHDVSYVTKRVTVASYDAFAPEYAARTAELIGRSRTQIGAFVAMVGDGARVLEIGSAQGRDAAALEAAGVSVRCTDITPAFVRILREQGRDADLLDPLTDDLADPLREAPYDGVWASASLLHVRREDLPTVLSRLADATRPGGALSIALKEGDGARFSTHGTISAPRHFTFWREGPLREVLGAAGWQVADVATDRDQGEQSWLVVRATRRDEA